MKNTVVKKSNTNEANVRRKKMKEWKSSSKLKLAKRNKIVATWNHFGLSWKYKVAKTKQNSCTLAQI